MPLIYIKNLDKVVILNESGFGLTMDELLAARPNYSRLEIPDNAESAYYDPSTETSYLSNGSKHMQWPISWPPADQILQDTNLISDITTARAIALAAAQAAATTAQNEKIYTPPS